MGIRKNVDMGTVAMPYRPQPDRVEAYEWCRQWWELWGFTVFTADSDPELPFSLSEARNNAVRAAQESDLGPGVMIVCDADTVPERMPLAQAVKIANEPGHVIYPYEQYRYLDAKYLKVSDENHNPEEAAVPLRSCPPTWVKDNSVGGIVVVHSTTYWDLGGMDEKFERRWGFEDNAFVAVADTLAKVIRLPGNVYSFGHGDDTGLRDWSKLNPNYWRNELYQHCWGNVKLMREMIK